MDQHPAYINYGNNVVGTENVVGGFRDYHRRGESERTIRRELKCGNTSNSFCSDYIVVFHCKFRCLRTQRWIGSNIIAWTNRIWWHLSSSALWNVSEYYPHIHATPFSLVQDRLEGLFSAVGDSEQSDGCLPRLRGRRLLPLHRTPAAPHHAAQELGLGGEAQTLQNRCE